MTTKKNSPSISRRDFLRLSAAAGGAAFLASCAQAPIPQAPAPTAASVVSSGKKYQDVTLRVLNQGGVAYEAALKQFGIEFEELTGAKVELDGTPWEQQMPKIQADLSSGQPKYDIFVGDIEFQYSIYPNLLPLNDLITKFNYNMDGFFEPVYKYGEGVAGGLKGQRFGLPIRVGACWVFYRTDLIDEFPTTWTDYEALLKEQTGGGKYGVSFAGVAAQLVKLFLARYWSLGDPLMSPDWQPLINSEKGVVAAEMLLNQIKNYAPPGILGWDNPDASNAFLNGDVAVLEGWAAFIQPDLQNPEKSKVIDKWSVAPYPEKGTGNFTQHNMDIIKSSKNPEAAFEYIAYATGLDNAKRLLMEFDEESPRKVIWTDDDVVKEKPFLPGVAASYANGKPFTPGVPQWLEMFIGLAEGLSSAMTEQEPVKNAMDEVARKWTELIKQNPLDFEYTE
jgi:multiple sugar transport system substrate-binding protein